MKVLILIFNCLSSDSQGSFKSFTNSCVGMMIFDIFNVGHLNKEWKVFQPFPIKFSFLVKSEKEKSSALKLFTCFLNSLQIRFAYSSIYAPYDVFHKPLQLIFHRERKKRKKEPLEKFNQQLFIIFLLSVCLFCTRFSCLSMCLPAFSWEANYLIVWIR